MNAFHVLGGLLAIWALVVSFLGIVRENFPSSDRAANLVMAVSAVLAALTIGSAIYTGATEDHESGESHEPGAVLRPL